MPRADTAATARRWATERAVDVWVLFAGDISRSLFEAMRPGIESIRADGGRFSLVIGADPGSVAIEADIADSTVSASGPAPSPFDLFASLKAAGCDDVRRLGVVGTSLAVLAAAHRAGAGAIVGIARDPVQRRALLATQADAIVTPERFGALDAERWAAGRAHRQFVLLNPGPSVVSDRVHRAIAGPDLCHREPEYESMFRRVRSRLLEIAHLDDSWATVLLAGSGTAAMEAMVGGSTRPGRRLLVCRNGVYGDRLAIIATHLGIDSVELTAPHEVPFDPAQIGDALDADPMIDAVAIVHHETTTGLLNPVHEVAAITRARGTLLCVDAISSFGAEDLDPTHGIDVVAATSNKCLHGLPGVAIVLMSPDAQARAAAIPARSVYLDLARYLDAQARGTVPFTPAIPATYALEAALDELVEEGGVPARRDRYRQRIAVLDAGLARLGLESTVPATHRSGSVRSLPLPDGVSYPVLHDAVKADGYVIYAGLGNAAGSSFRVCALGEVDGDALDGFIGSLGRALGVDGGRLSAVREVAR